MAKSKKQAELPEMTGTGVAPVRIAELEPLAEAYVKERDKRLTLTPKEVEAKRRLVEAMRLHEDQLKQPDGRLVYLYDETRVTATPGTYKVKVEDISEKMEAE